MEGYVTDVDGDDTMMNSPEATVFIKLSSLPPAQALAIAQAGEHGLSDEQLGRLLNGEGLESDFADVKFHLTVGQALTALSAVGAIDISEDPPEETNE